MLTEERRHKMVESFKETNGEETAMALAESLFSNDFATKDDIKELRTELKGDIKSLDAKLDRHFGWLMGGILGSYGAIIAALGIGIAVVLNTS